MAKIGQYAWAIAHAKGSLWVKNLKCQKGAKNDCPTTLELLCAKTAPKNTEYLKDESILKMAKIGQYAWAIAHAKWSLWVKN